MKVGHNLTIFVEVVRSEIGSTICVWGRSRDGGFLPDPFELAISLAPAMGFGLTGARLARKAEGPQCIENDRLRMSYIYDSQSFLWPCLLMKASSFGLRQSRATAF